MQRYEMEIPKESVLKLPLGDTGSARGEKKMDGVWVGSWLEFSLVGLDMYQIRSLTMLFKSTVKRGGVAVCLDLGFY